MKNIIHITHFYHIKDVDFITDVRKGISGMGSNPDVFPNPVPALHVWAAAVNKLQYLYGEALCGGRNERLSRDAQRLVVMDMLKEQVWYVEYCCKSDRIKGLKSGLPLIKERQSTPPIEGVSQPLLKQGLNSGHLLAIIKSVDHSVTYSYAITTDSTLPLSAWEKFSWHKVRYTFKNLVPGTIYYVVVIAIGKDGQQVKSPVAKHMVI